MEPNFKWATKYRDRKVEKIRILSNSKEMLREIISGVSINQTNQCYTYTFNWTKNQAIHQEFHFRKATPQSTF